MSLSAEGLSWVRMLYTLKQDFQQNGHWLWRWLHQESGSCWLYKCEDLSSDPPELMWKRQL